MSRSYKNIMYTPDVQAAQLHANTREAAERMRAADQAPDRLTDRETGFIRERDGFYIASVNADGWPYVQFRGGPPGFLEIIDDRTLAFADFRGNQQLLSVGNLSTDDRVSLFIMDYANRRRLKILAHATVRDLADDPELARRLIDPDYHARPERAMIFDIVAFDWNCPQHITPRFTEREFAQRSRGST
jgi:predicted pyridoxine 5'-phosphate oxidase superfamily flavin-nucleotide-binding protein